LIEVYFFENLRFGDVNASCFIAFPDSFFLFLSLGAGLVIAGSLLYLWSIVTWTG